MASEKQILANRPSGLRALGPYVRVFASRTHGVERSRPIRAFRSRYAQALMMLR